jgi:signal transduction histidine kinase
MFELVERGRNLPTWIWRALNLAAAGGLLVLSIAVPWIDTGVRPGPGQVLLDALAATSAAAGFWWPRVALAVTVLVCLVALVVHLPEQPLVVTMLLALFHIGRRRPSTEALWITVGTAAVTTAVALVYQEIAGIDARFWSWTGWCLFTGAAGSIAQGHHAHIVAAQERRERDRRMRERETAARVTEERLRIARDLHDVIGHSITMINVQSGVAEHVLDTDPEAARTALRRINEASATALDEIRTTLGLLRAERPATAATLEAENIPGLVSDARENGVPAELQVRGTPRELPRVVRCTAYRVVQECLTNVVKHGLEVTHVGVLLAYGPGRVTVEVANDGARAEVREADGRGLTGMRERLAAVGGTVTAVAPEEGGFRVTAILPTEARP